MAGVAAVVVAAAAAVATSGEIPQPLMWAGFGESTDSPKPPMMGLPATGGQLPESGLNLPNSRRRVCESAAHLDGHHG